MTPRTLGGHTGFGQPDDLIALIRDAIRRGHQLICDVHGYRREVCPHILGRPNGTWQTLVWQFAGDSERGGLPMWRRFDLIDIAAGAFLRPGEWHRGWIKGDRHRWDGHIDTVVPAERAAVRRGW